MERCLALGLILLLISCRDKELTSWSLIHGDSLNSKFVRAEEFMRLGKFEEAKAEYQKLQSYGLLAVESEYASLSERLAHLLTNDSVVTDATAGSPHDARLYGLVHLTGGINSFHINNSGISALSTAKREFEKSNQTHSIPFLLTLSHLAIYYRAINQNDSAIFYFKKAVQITEQEKKLEHLQPALLFQLAELSLMLRDTYSGLMYVQQGLNNKTTTEEEKGKLITLKGTMFRKLRQYDSAERYYLEAEKILRSGFAESYAVLLRERALKATLLKDRNAFAVIIEDMKGIDSLSRGPEVNLDRLYGYFYFTFDDPAKSTTHYERAARVLRKQKIPETVQLGEAYYLLTEQYRKLKRFKEAELSCYEGMTYNSSLKDLPFEWTNLLNKELRERPNNFIDQLLMADLYLDHFNYDKSPIHLGRALYLYQMIDSATENQVRVHEDDARILYGDYGFRACSGGIQACFKQYQLTKDTSMLNLAHHFLEKSKALLIDQDMLARQREYFPQIPDDFRDKEFRIKGKIAQLKKDVSGLSTGELTKSIRELEDYYGQMKVSYPEYYHSRFQTAVKPFGYFQKLSGISKKTFVQYHITKNNIYFLTYNIPAQFERVQTDSIFEKNYIEFIDRIGHPPSLDDKHGLQKLLAQSNFLYKKLIQPVRIDDQQLVILPEGILSQLPFEVLVADTARKFKHSLLSNYTISYAHSLRSYDIDFKGGSSINVKKILGYAHSSPDGKDSKKYLPGLTGARRELEVLENLFSESSLTLRSGREATRSQFLKDIDQPFDILQISMHASSSGANKFDNKIFFNSPGKPEPLYGFDIATHKLQADLVVLTGCETAYGPWVTGEGTFSLARAFKQTGVKHIVPSLWSIPDQTSSEIVKIFYQNLKGGKPIDVSLREAKLAYLAAADEITAHPYFWASLISF